MKKVFQKFNSEKISTRALMLAFVFGVVCVNSVFASLTITPVTWNVVGLDSNNVAVGPNVFPLGARVCNISGGAVK
jgi:3D (Asp-Asp-Asp) domain-containing protein